MGHILVDAEVTGKRKRKIKMIVDTGASHTVLPWDIARKIGVSALSTPVRVRLADGSRQRMRVGAVIVKLAGREAGATVLIGRSGIQPLLGVEVLQMMGLGLDMRSHKVRPLKFKGPMLVGLRYY